MEHSEVNICKSYTACYRDEINNGAFNIGLIKKKWLVPSDVYIYKNNNHSQRKTFSQFSTCIGKMFILI